MLDEREALDHVKTGSRPSDLKITDIRFADIWKAPMQCIMVKVYTNQPKAALYADGKLIEEQTGDRVFNFRVPLNGTVTLEVRAGECRDTAVFHKVAVPNPAYKLVRKKSSSANWV